MAEDPFKAAAARFGAGGSPSPSTDNDPPAPPAPPRETGSGAGGGTTMTELTPELQAAIVAAVQAGVAPVRDEVHALRAENKVLGKELKKARKAAEHAVARPTSIEADAEIVAKAAGKAFIKHHRDAEKARVKELEEAGAAVGNLAAGGEPDMPRRGSATEELPTIELPAEGKRFYLRDELRTYILKHGNVPEDADIRGDQVEFVQQTLEELRNGPVKNDAPKKKGWWERRLNPDED